LICNSFFSELGIAIVWHMSCKLIAQPSVAEVWIWNTNIQKTVLAYGQTSYIWWHQLDLCFHWSVLSQRWEHQKTLHHTTNLCSACLRKSTDWLPSYPSCYNSRTKKAFTYLSKPSLESCWPKISNSIPQQCCAIFVLWFKFVNVSPAKQTTRHSLCSRVKSFLICTQ